MSVWPRPLGPSHARDHAGVLVLLWLAYFTEHNVLKGHPRCCRCLFQAESHPVVWVGRAWTIHLCTWGCCHLLGIVNNAAMTTGALHRGSEQGCDTAGLCFRQISLGRVDWRKDDQPGGQWAMRGGSGHFLLICGWNHPSRSRVQWDPNTLQAGLLQIWFTESLQPVEQYAAHSRPSTDPNGSDRQGCFRERALSSLLTS